jgi:hypothetical protein
MCKLRTILGVIIVCLAAGAAESVPVYRQGFRGHPWIEWRYPDGDSVGQNCHGNCGRGCNDSWNPCGGRQQYWVQEMLDEPQVSGGGNYRVSCDSYSGTLYVFRGQVYVAPMRETYNGFQTAACLAHDATCGTGWAFFGCLWPPNALCPFDRQDKEWSWVAGRDGRLWELEEIIEGGCPADGYYP